MTTRMQIYSLRPPAVAIGFGIVTRVHLQTYEQGLVRSPSQKCDGSVLDTSMKDFVRLSAAPDCDKHVSFLVLFAYIGSVGLSDIVNSCMAILCRILPSTQA